MTEAELAKGGRCFVELRRGEEIANVEGEVRWLSAVKVERTEDTLRPVFGIGLAFVDGVGDGHGGLLDQLVPQPRSSSR